MGVWDSIFKHREGSKIHAVVDASSMPLYLTVGPGNEHDSWRLLELVNGLYGRPEEFYPDSAYDTENIRSYLSSMDVESNIPVNSMNGGKPSPYNIELYKRMRSAVERFFGWLKSFRRIILRYERLAVTYRTFINIIIHLMHRHSG
jgi:transposase